MDNILAARCQMGMSLAFHIIFACIGIALPFMMVFAELVWLKTKDHYYLLLAKRWATGSAILFAVGAVSGTLLSFELGLLWPKFMEFAGAIIGLPFALEGYAFFAEAIFLGIYLYGWKRVSPVMHAVSGLIVAFNGALSGAFVVAANAWMNTPAGFTVKNGKPENIVPVDALLNPASGYEAVHMLIAAYMATAAAMAGIHAFMLLKDKTNAFHQRALLLACVLAASMALLQPITGDSIARMVARVQPIKLASLEGQFQTERSAPLRIGGIPDMAERRTNFALEIPYGLSILAFHDPNAVVKGLNDFPRDEWPFVPAVHICFQIMVGCGSVLSMMALWTFFLLFRKEKLYDHPWFLKATVACTPLGFLAVETGWMVTEMGRQPWIIVGVMRAAQASTPVPGIAIQMWIFFAVYLALAFVVVLIVKRQVVMTATKEDVMQLEAGENAR